MAVSTGRPPFQLDRHHDVACGLRRRIRTHTLPGCRCERAHAIVRKPRSAGEVTSQSVQARATRSWPEADQDVQPAALLRHEPRGQGRRRENDPGAHAPQAPDHDRQYMAYRPQPELANQITRALDPHSLPENVVPIRPAAGDAIASFLERLEEEIRQVATRGAAALYRNRRTAHGVAPDVIG
jgi:hypothetical protein